MCSTAVQRHAELLVNINKCGFFFFFGGLPNNPVRTTTYCIGLSTHTSMLRHGAALLMSKLTSRRGRVWNSHVWHENSLRSPCVQCLCWLRPLHEMSYTRDKKKGRSWGGGVGGVGWSKLKKKKIVHPLIYQLNHPIRSGLRISWYSCDCALSLFLWFT